jgi:hypothetical protein
LAEVSEKQDDFFDKIKEFNDSIVKKWSYHDIYCPTHHQIYSLLDQYKTDGFISHQTVSDLLNFRLVANDIFRLLDFENTRKIGYYGYNQEDGWDIGDIDQDFLDVMKENLNMEDENTTNWFGSFVKESKKDMDYETF